MINGGIEKVIEWLNLNNIDTWAISTSKDRSASNYVFRSREGVPVADEQVRMRETLALSSNEHLYVYGKAGSRGNSANFSEEFSNNVQPQPIQQPMTVGAIAGYNQSSIETMVANAVEKERMAWERKELDREREEVRQARQAYEEQQSSVLGLLVQKAAPFIQSIMGVQSPSLAVGSVANEITAEPIKARRAEPTPVEETEESVEATEEVFTDEESNELFAIVERWKNADPNYLQVITRIVEFAESGEPISVAGGLVKLNYEQIKEMIL